ncbi:MAG: hypothetical protein HQ591_07620, partial [candidate division Zixibacteria bacterium]|nr:hypothetical protein [Candidatus Tariuqbacter arcticus]
MENIPGKPGGSNSNIASNSSMHFKFRKRTQYLYPIVIDTINIEGIVPEAGDEIGVFMWDTLCVGAKVYDGSGSIIITAWQDEINTPAITDGYIDYETMSFKYWDTSDEEEFDITLSYSIASAGDEANKTYTTNPVFGLKNYAKITFCGNPNIAVPANFTLHQNYPNPFNPITNLRFELPEVSNVKLNVYN